MVETKPRLLLLRALEMPADRLVSSCHSLCARWKLRAVCHEIMVTPEVHKLGQGACPKCGMALWEPGPPTCAVSWPRSFATLSCFLSRKAKRAHSAYELVVVIIALVLLGQVMEFRARSQTGSGIRALLGLPQVGDRLRVRPGEKIPVDGVVRPTQAKTWSETPGRWRTLPILPPASQSDDRNAAMRFSSALVIRKLAAVANRRALGAPSSQDRYHRSLSLSLSAYLCSGCPVTQS